MQPPHSSNASQTGSAVSVEEEYILFVVQFVRNTKQTVVLSDNSQTESARVGFKIVEEIITPEGDESLTDNACRDNKLCSKGAHRLKTTLTLERKDLTSTDDTDFVELMRLRDGLLVSQARSTEFSVLGDGNCKRTFDESGDYTVRPFQFEVKRIC